MKKLLDGMKNAKLEKQMKIMILSACLLSAGVWTAHTAAFHATDKTGYSDLPAALEMQQSKVCIAVPVGETIVAAGVQDQDTANSAGADGKLT